MTTSIGTVHMVTCNVETYKVLSIRSTCIYMACMVMLGEPIGQQSLNECGLEKKQENLSILAINGYDLYENQIEISILIDIYANHEAVYRLAWLRNLVVRDSKMLTGVLMAVAALLMSFDRRGLEYRIKPLAESVAIEKQ